MKMKNFATILAILCAVTAAPVSGQADQTEWERMIRAYNIPQWASPVLLTPPFSENYDVSFALNPFYLRGDFNGDGELDVAVLVEEKSSGKRGIAIVHGGADEADEPIVVGAGRPLRDGDDDFRWLDVWMVYPKDAQPPGGFSTFSMPDDAVADEGLYLEKVEAASGVVYWNGRAYVWSQLGD